ncbi:MAG: hypothetical protein HC896_15000, partial [Bacteroidales bacterium]|nr:hypothetical protein [Bacteroidales bacterium]
MEFGKNYFWITVDVDSAAVENNIVDMSIDAQKIKTRLDTSVINFNQNIYPVGNNVYYIVDGVTNVAPIENNIPSTERSPVGAATILTSVIFEDFEDATGWTLTGDFEIGMPQGLGANVVGNPDPTSAISGNKVLGSDLSVNGDYPDFTNDTIYWAQSPSMDLTYFRSLYLVHYRWLNTQSFDSAKIAISVNGSEHFKNIKKYAINDLFWNWEEIDLSSFNIDRSNGVSVRYKLSPDGDAPYSGWNIDNFAIIGDFISKDITVRQMVSPKPGCIGDDKDSVSVWVRNYAGIPTPDTIPITYSFY